MGIPVIIYGKSGTGKSRSLKDFKDDEVFLVNVLNKPLPFRKAFKYTASTDNLTSIMQGLSRMSTHGIKTAIIDDFGYIMTNLFMRGHGSGDQFKLYNQIGDAIWTLINFIQSPAVQKDAIVYLIMHEEVADDGTNKLRTIGKLLDQKVCIEGMATVVLHSCIKGERYVFETQNNGASIAKSPEGMFKDLEIPNDLKAVDDAIRDYWKIQNRKEEQENVD